jgi:hypothetical protein
VQKNWFLIKSNPHVPGGYSKYMLSNYTTRRKFCDVFAPRSPLLLAFQREVCYYMQKIMPFYRIKPARILRLLCTIAKPCLGLNPRRPHTVTIGCSLVLTMNQPEPVLPPVPTSPGAAGHGRKAKPLMIAQLF